jgi:transcriptional regulator with XRE-family HTH domain
MSFGRTLARLREAAGLTQTQLAQKAGVAIDSFRRWEQDRHLPRVDLAYRLAEALGVGIEELVIGEDMKDVPPEEKPKRGKRQKAK